MTLTKAQIRACAKALFDAETKGKQIGLLSVKHPGMTIEDAYEVQGALVGLKRAAGAAPIGWKIGLTSRAMQDALKIDTPDSGLLLDDMAFVDGGDIPAGRFIQPRVEAEIAFIMQTPLKGTHITREHVISATASVAPALEILDTRIKRSDPKSGQMRSVVDTIADNAANAGVVLGEARHAITDVDLRWTGAIVKRDGVVEETGLGAGVLNDPVTSVVWLVHRLAQFGAGLLPGDIVLSGSFIRPIEAPSGALIEADFGAFGQVSCRFE